MQQHAAYAAALLHGYGATGGQQHHPLHVHTPQALAWRHKQHAITHFRQQHRHWHCGRCETHDVPAQALAPVGIWGARHRQHTQTVALGGGGGGNTGALFGGGSHTSNSLDTNCQPTNFVPRQHLHCCAYRVPHHHGMVPHFNSSSSPLHGLPAVCLLCTSCVRQVNTP
jgi:hypothetical protein